MPEGEESDLFHAGKIWMIGRVCESSAGGKNGDKACARKRLLEEAGKGLDCSWSLQISQPVKFKALSKPPNALSRQVSVSLAAFAR